MRREQNDLPVLPETGVMSGDMEPVTLLVLFGIMLLLSAIPGPSDLALVARALTAGTTPALAMVAGILTGDALLLLVAIFSLGALATLLTEATVYLQLAASITLIGFGLRHFFIRTSGETDQPGNEQHTHKYHQSGAHGVIYGADIQTGQPHSGCLIFGELPQG